MAVKLKKVMTPEPTMLPTDAPLKQAAQLMRDDDIGDVLVTENGRLAGILTDRDIVVRAVADGFAPESVKVGDIASRDVVTCSPDDTIDNAVKAMRSKALHRLPILDNGNVVGTVSIGDLAARQAPKSALADISTAPPNR